MDNYWTPDSHKHPDGPRWGLNNNQSSEPRQNQLPDHSLPYEHRGPPDSSSGTGVEFNNGIEPGGFQSAVFPPSQALPHTQWVPSHHPHQRSYTHPNISSTPGSGNPPAHTPSAPSATHLNQTAGQSLSLGQGYELGSVHPEVLPARQFPHQQSPHHSHQSSHHAHSGQHNQSRAQMSLPLGQLGTSISGAQSRHYDSIPQSAPSRLYMHRHGEVAESSMPLPTDQFSGLGSTEMHGFQKSFFQRTASNSKTGRDAVPNSAHIALGERGGAAPYHSILDRGFTQFIAHPASDLPLVGDAPFATRNLGHEPTSVPGLLPKRRRGRPRVFRPPPPPKPRRESKRLPHNEVERRYREGLNSEMEALRDAVPILYPSDYETDGEDGEESQKPHLHDIPQSRRKRPSRQSRQRMSKGLILSHALEYIIFLENECGRLVLANRQLRTRFVHMGEDSGMSPDLLERGAFFDAFIEQIISRSNTSGLQGGSESDFLPDLYDFHRGAHFNYSRKRTGAWRDALITRLKKRFLSGDNKLGGLKNGETSAGKNCSPAAVDEGEGESTKSEDLDGDSSEGFLELEDSGDEDETGENVKAGADSMSARLPTSELSSHPSRFDSSMPTSAANLSRPRTGSLTGCGYGKAGMEGNEGVSLAFFGDHRPPIPPHSRWPSISATTPGGDLNLKAPLTPPGPRHAPGAR